MSFRFLGVVQKVFNEKGKLIEKYNVVDGTAGGGGEYKAVDGFGWTNGVVQRLLLKK